MYRERNAFAGVLFVCFHSTAASADTKRVPIVKRIGTLSGYCLALVAEISGRHHGGLPEINRPTVLVVLRNNIV